MEKDSAPPNPDKDAENWRSVFGQGLLVWSDSGDGRNVEVITIVQTVDTAKDIPESWLRIDVENPAVEPGEYTAKDGSTYRVYGSATRIAGGCSEQFVFFDSPESDPGDSVCLVTPLKVFRDRFGLRG